MHAELNPGHSFRSEDGIWIDRNWTPVGVTSQFLENADTYHQRYYNNGYWRYLISRAFDFMLERDKAVPLRLLDVGSGSGNTVFAAAAEFPNATIVASDISPDLLKILHAATARIEGASGRVACYCVDFHKDVFRREQFDHVIGGAILHHMLDPLEALRNAFTWLKPGGHIVLFEPMEAGAHLMSAVYGTLRDELEGQIPSDLMRFFNGIIEDYEARFGVPRIKPWTANLDDKWVFNATYLRGLARELGCSNVTIRPLTDDFSTMFEQAVLGTLGASGRPRELPQCALDLLRKLDAGVSADVKSRMVAEAIVLLTK